MAIRGYIGPALAAGLAMLAVPAFAHPKLEAASPAVNGSVRGLPVIQLRFSEKLIGRFSGAELIMAGHPPAKVAVSSTIAADGRTLVLRPARAVRPGSYRVNFHVVSTDTHRVQGGYNFTVK